MGEDRRECRKAAQLDWIERTFCEGSECGFKSRRGQTGKEDNTPGALHLEAEPVGGVFTARSGFARPSRRARPTVTPAP